MPALKSEYVKLRARVLVAPHVIVGSVRLAVDSVRLAGAASATASNVPVHSSARARTYRHYASAAGPAAAPCSVATPPLTAP
eukprot:CAMPEP_0182559854 /NCGR_PEP_ID=MMETSP1324-20130603/2820_1 /TAXON_ID=236786 /ORGANISM="Florenciella sp., Strain RCC1587" /LENGTH=81 /DNA_ID=CAMNT_0024772169 /DNA_START=183 /DNA_END=425 /DNA_ORIENTATION=+